MSIMVAMEREVTAWFRQQPKEFYAAGFQGLVKRWDKCLSVQGAFVSCVTHMNKNMKTDCKAHNKIVKLLPYKATVMLSLHQ
jgi:hypothetical protein